MRPASAFALVALVALVSLVSLAQERPVSPVSVTVGLTRYEALAEWPGFVFARAVKSGELFYVTHVAPNATGPFTSMRHDEKAEVLELVDGAKTPFRMTLREKERGSHWPVKLTPLSSKPFKVRVMIPNLGKTSLDLDSPTVCAEGRPRNSVFIVEVDGKPVPYRGMMAKRAPPDDFTVVKPGKQFEVEVDLSDVYELPAKGAIRVRFESFNHFSKDEVTLVSNFVDVPR